jgi:hypothetical protein
MKRQAIDSARGRQLYSQRIGTVEPVFANIRHNKRLDRFTLRGKEKVNTQWPVLPGAQHREDWQTGRRSNAPVLFAASSGSVARISLLAWVASVALFAVCGALNHWLTQYSGNTIFRLYPLLQQLASLVLFFWFLVHRVSPKRAAQPAATRTRVLWSLAVSAAPTVLLVAAANIWHLSRGNS